LSFEVKTIIHKFIVLILQWIMTMMKKKMMALSKGQLKCPILEYINPFNGIILLITYWEAFDEG